MARGRTGVGCPWETVGSTRGVRGLGQVVPLAGAVGTTAVKYLIGSVLAGAGAAIVGGMLGGPDTQDSWADRTVFNARMRATHAGFLMVQCQVGGAKVNEGYGCDDNDHNCLCPGGTHPRCSLPSGKLTEWRALRSNFSAFYSEVGGATYFESDNWTVSDPTPGEILQARGFARSLVAFFIALPSVCPNYTLPFDLADIVAADEGTTAQMVAEQTAITLAEPEPTWVKGARYVAWGLGAVAVLWVGNTLYTLPFDLADIVAADEGTTAQMVAEQTAITLAEPEPTWVKGARYVAWGLGAVTVLWVGNTLYTVYKDRKRA